MQDKGILTQRLETLSQKVSQLVNFSLNLESQKAADPSRFNQTVAKILQILTQKENFDDLHEDQVSNIFKSQMCGFLNLNNSLECLIQPQDLQLEETIREKNILKDFASESIFLQKIQIIGQEHGDENNTQINNQEHAECLSNKQSQNKNSPQSNLEEQINKFQKIKPNHVEKAPLRKSERIFLQTNPNIKKQNFELRSISETPQLYLQSSCSQRNIYYEDQDDTLKQPNYKASSKKKKIVYKRKKITKKINKKYSKKYTTNASNKKVKVQKVKKIEDQESKPISKSKKGNKKKNAKAKKVYKAYPATYKPRTSGRKPSYPEMEKELSTWIHQMLAREIRITHNTIRQRARRIMEKKYGEATGFRASKGWVQKFFRRYPSIFALICQKKNSKLADIEIPKQQEPYNLSKIFQKPNQKDVKVEQQSV